MGTLVGVGVGNLVGTGVTVDVGRGVIVDVGCTIVGIIVGTSVPGIDIGVALGRGEGITVGTDDTRVAVGSKFGILSD